MYLLGINPCVSVAATATAAHCVSRAGSGSTFTGKRKNYIYQKLCQVKDFQNPGPSLKGLVMESHIEAPKRSLSCFQCGDSKDVV